MNDYCVIKNYLIGDLNYCFEIDGYWFPKFIGNANLKQIREKELKEESGYVKKFKKDIGKYKILKNGIQEFPFPIEYTEEWKNLLKISGMEENSKHFQTRFFKLDFFYPDLNLCIEIDSSYHYSKAKYDQARDAYLSGLYGIKTIRLLNYGEDAKNLKLNTEILKDGLKYLQPKPKINLDFGKYMVEKYIEDNKDIFSQIVKIRNTLGDKFLISRKIEIPKNLNIPEDLKKKTSEMIEKIYKKLVV